MASIRSTRFLTPVTLFLMAYMLLGCASNAALRAEYGPLSCPVDAVIIEKEGPVVMQTDVKASDFRYNKRKLNWRQSIYFATGQSVVKPSDQQQVAVNIATLNQFPHFKLLVKGFTDSSGSAEFNAKLSLKRVFSVSQLLLDQGIEADRIYISAEGETAPLNQDVSASDKAVNRRVDMVLLGPHLTDDYQTLSDFRQAQTTATKGSGE